VNEFTKHDPTLPRINTIKCPNHECISNTASMAGGGGGASSTSSKKEEKTALDTSDKDNNNNNNNNNGREVIYIRYDDVNMKYVYLCVHCNTTWKTDNR
jgi:DNA-directed RNA polymerase subunit M/transcription elongation factor TFIIS